MKTPYIVVPEHIVRNAAEVFAKEDGSKINTFQKMLLVGEEYKQANMTPIYLYDPVTSEVFVQAEDRLKNKLH
jgi:hypothetical protein